MTLCVCELARIIAPAYEPDMSNDLASRIRRLRQSRGLNQADFGAHFGVTQSTVTRWESGAVPAGDKLTLLAAFAGVELSEFVGADFETAPPSNRLWVKGEVQAGVWKDAWQWEPDDWQPYQGGAHVDAPQDRRFGLVVVGESMNEVYPPGTILDCVHLIGGLSDIRDKQNVIVIRKKYADGCEATVKQFRVIDGKFWLVPRSSHPAFQAAIEIGNEDPDIEETVVIAIVRGSYKPE